MERECPPEGHGLKSRVGLLEHTLVSKPDMGDKTVCCLFLPSVFTSPQNQPSRPLSPLGSLDPPCRKPWLWLGRTLLPSRVSSHTEDMGREDSCPSQFSCRIYNALSQIRQSLLRFPVI